MGEKKILLREDEMPTQWYNILADIKMNPPLGPDGKPIGPESLAPVFPMNIIEQEVSTDRWIDIPEEVLGIYKIWRPSPLIRATALKKPWILRQRFTLNMKVSALPVVINQIQLWPRHIITRSSALKKSQRKPEPASGVVPCHLPVPSLDWNARFIW